MKPVLIYCLLFLWSGRTIAQNLLANGGFEEENICIEYDKDCAPEAWIATSLFYNYYFDVTLNSIGDAHTGTHFVALTAGSLGMQGVRNFIRTRLLCGMQKGKQYKLQMYVRANYPILDSIGIYFSEQDYLYEKRYFKILDPQLWSVNGRDTTIPHSEWQKIVLLYTANGTEGYVTIGNYKREDYKDISRADYRADYYFFLDDVSLRPVDTTEKLCFQADSVKDVIYRESERHSYLERKIVMYRRKPPPPVPLPKTLQKKKVKVPHIDTLIIPDIFFATASYELSPLSFNLLDSFANKLSTYRVDSMIVEGHTDSIGRLAYNETLSLNRAGSVKNYLSGKVAGLDAKSITRGFAFLRPVASNRTPKGRQMNRRVEIFLYRDE